MQIWKNDSGAVTACTRDSSQVEVKDVAKLNDLHVIIAVPLPIPSFKALLKIQRTETSKGIVFPLVCQGKA